MPLQLREVRSGAVAYFDHVRLLSEADIEHHESGLDRPGPFLCVQVVGAQSVWCAITSHERPERLFLKEAWRRDGAPGWRQTAQYLQDGLNTYLGPSEAFVRAAIDETPFTPFRRPWLTPSGVAAVLQEIQEQSGRLL